MKKSHLKLLIKEIIKESILDDFKKRNFDDGRPIMGLDNLKKRHEFDDGREPSMGFVNVEEGFVQGEYTPVQQQAINTLENMGFQEVASFPNEPDADGGGMDDKVTVVLQKKAGVVKISVEVDADGMCNGKPVKEFISSGMAKEQINPDGRYQDDMENGTAVKRLHNLDEWVSNNYSYWMITKKDNMVGSQSGNDLKKLLVLAKERDYDEFAVYKNEQGFHSTSQMEYLIYWYDKSPDDGYYSNVSRKNHPEVAQKQIRSLDKINTIIGKKIREITGTGAVSGYATPFAFSKRKSGSKRALDVTTRMGFKKVKDI